MSERIWAAIGGGVIINTFVGDDDFADMVRADYDDVVEITFMSPMPGVRWTVEAEGYRVPRPWPSWSWNGAAWAAPTPRPETSGAWMWDEESQAWIDVTPPTE